MKRFLLVYGTREGQTARIADLIATDLRNAGNIVDERNLRHGAPPSLADYDAVIVGGSVHVGGYEREVRRWVRANRAALDAVPNAFFSVSLSGANSDAMSVAEMDAVIERFVKTTGWRPNVEQRFAGALVYSEYNWFVKRMMRRIVRKESNGEYQDMTRDYDLTDYDAVHVFALRLAGSAAWSPMGVPRP
jgi:menaquinone-dependent protoporphyrinogen oxidase